MFHRIVCSFAVIVAISIRVLGCDSCGTSIGDPARGGGAGTTAGFGDSKNLFKNLTISSKTGDAPEQARITGDVPDVTQPLPESKPRRWSVDTTFEFREFQTNTAENSFKIVQAGHDQHAYRYDYFVNEHIGYMVTDDLSVGVLAGFRSLHKINVDAAQRLGQHETSTGATDLTFDAKYRFIHQSECFPLDMAVFAAVKTPFGETRNRRNSGDLFEVEDQPGTGSWNGTLGVAASHAWAKWGASASASYTYKSIGSEEFKEGDLVRLSLSGSRLLTPECYAWKLYASAGLQGFVERHAVDHHVTSPDHGGRFMYFVPGIAAKPNDRIIVSLSAPIPVIQDENGTHQKQRWNVQLGVGLRF